MILLRWLAVPCISISASAQTTDVTKALDSVKTVGTSPQECPGCTFSSDSSSKNPVQECVESICGDPKFSNTLLMDSAYHTGVDMKLYDQQIAPLVKSIVKSHAESELTRLQSAIDWLKSAPKEVTDPKVVGLANLYLGTELFNTAMVRSDGQLDFGATRKNYPNLSNEDFYGRAHAFLKHLENFKDLKLNAFQVSAMKLMYPGDKFDKKIAELLTELKTLERENDASTQVGFFTKSPFYKDNYSASVIEGNLKKGSITSEDLMALGRTLLMQRAMTAFRTDMMFNSRISRPINMSRLADKEFMARVHAELSTAKERLEDVSKYGQNCRDIYILGQGFLPTEAQKTKFEGLIPGIKKAFKANIKGLISQHSSVALFAKVDSVRIGLPPSKNEHFQMIKKTLTHDAKVMDGWRQRHDAIMNDTDRLMPIYVALRGIRNGSSNTALNYLPEAQCLSMTPSLLPDSSLLGYDGVLVGPMVMKFGANAEGIMHHELAHQISVAVQADPNLSDATKSWYVRSRECLKINHTRAYGEYGDYREEDWADMLAANTGPKKNFACSGVRMSKKTARWYSNMSMRNLNQWEPHSANLFRAFHVQSIIGKSIPEVCKTAVAAKKQKIDFKNCAKP